MRVAASGWSRHMGSNPIFNKNLENLVICDDAWVAAASSWDNNTAFINSDRLEIFHGRKIRLNGDYRVRIEIEKDEIAFIFKKIFGDNLSQEILDRFGLSVDESVLVSMLEKRTFSEIVRLTGDNHHSETVNGPTPIT
ncbi:hypothetical protein [Inquilinus sp. CAU 1745]|uniref:hypothetical protein n=1 Tax=Inquilinus sp. CAU 1745 TaxID=3140369 RepID=UPI00325B53C1